MAEIGAGASILPRHFPQWSPAVYASEPDAEMRRMAEAARGDNPAFRSVAGPAAAATLPDQAVYLIAVWQALDWFEQRAARQEFCRILKLGGWLAGLWNHSTDPALQTALQELFTPAYGW